METPSTPSPPSPIAPPPQSPPLLPSGCPLRTKCIPHRLNPDDFGAYSHQKETIANAYEDLLNGKSSANAAITDDDFGLVHNVAHMANDVAKHDPNLPDTPTLCKALAGPKCDAWHTAILEELATIKDTGTWVLVDRMPDIQNVVGCHFILQKKCGADGNITHFKAHLITQGFSQQEGIDYSETFAPVVKSASLCVFLAICA